MSITAARPFKGRQYSGEVILTAVRWKLRYLLAYEHVAELLAERGLAVDASCLCCLSQSPSNKDFTKVGDDYYPLPVQWDIHNKKWLKYHVPDTSTVRIRVGLSHSRHG